MSVYRELLVIKSFRESRAELALFRQRQVLLQAQAEEDAARATLTEFEAFAARREASVYKDLCSRVVMLRDIEDAQIIIADLRKQKEERELEVATAGQKREQESGVLIEVQGVHKAAARMKQKFVELSLAESVEVAREAERKEDLELEESASNGRPKNGSNQGEMEESR